MNKNSRTSRKHWIIILIILISSYSLYTGFSQIIDSNKNKKEWKPGDFDILVQKCMEDSKQKAEIYPSLTKEYCSCSMGQIMKKFNRKEYVEIKELPIEEQLKYLIPEFKDCFDKYNNEIIKKENLK